MLEFPKSISDGDIELVKLDATFENTKAVFDLIDKNRDYFREWLDWVDFVKRPEDEFMVLKKDATADSGEYYIKSTNKIIGKTGFVKLNEKAKFGEIGYFLDREYTGRGIMTRAIKMIEKLAFGQLGFERIEIRTSTTNHKSAAIPERLGYKMEGIARQSYLFYGVLRDTKVFSKLKSEWLEEK